MVSRVTAIVPAAGLGRRMGHKTPKQFLQLQGKPILIFALETFERSENIQDVILVVPETENAYLTELLKKWKIKKVHKIVSGGNERQQSVQNGLNALDSQTSWVAIHDGVRPFLSLEKLYSVLEAAFRFGSAILATPIHDTVKCVDEGRIRATMDRSRLWRAQTPQVFRRDWLEEAYRNASNENLKATDDAELVEKLGYPVHVVQGDETNIKITSPIDLAIAERLLDRGY